jgi:hypothetical protein
MLIGTALADFDASTVVATAPAVVPAVVVRMARRDRPS